MSTFFRTTDNNAENIRQMDTEVTKLQNAVEEAKSRASEAESKKRELQQKIYQLEREIASNNSDELRYQLRNMQDELRKAVENCNQMKALNEKIKNELNQTKKDLEEARRTNRLTAAKLREQQEKTNRLTAEISQLKNEAQAREERIKYLNNQLEELQERERRRRSENPWLIAGLIFFGLLTGAALFMVASTAVFALGVIGLIVVMAIGIYAVLRR